MTFAGAALTALVIMMFAVFVSGALIIGGRIVRTAREARRAELAKPARRLLLAIAAGDDADGLPDGADPARTGAAFDGQAEAPATPGAGVRTESGS